MAIPVIKIIDRDDNEYSFPPDFFIIDDSYQTSINVSNKSFAAGGRQIADGFLTPRVIVLEGELRKESKAAMETARRAMEKAILSAVKLEISDDSVDRYIGITAPQVVTGWSAYPYEKTYSISFTAEDPFYRDASVQTDAETVAGDDTLTVDNSGSDFLVFPVITIENDQSVDNPGIKMINRTDGSMTFSYIDANFLSGDVLTIDCEQGTVKKNNTNAIANFNPGRFFRLQPASNSIEYVGAACTITFTFRRGYL